MAREHVTVEREGDVGRIVMERPEQNNAMDPQMAEEMRSAAAELAHDDDVRCIVFTGTGATFNTGADLSTLEGDETDATRIRTLAGRLHETVSALMRAPKPVVCGVNGVAAGGGLGPAVCGDIVVVAESGRFEFAYPRIGLSADGGSTYFLPRLVGVRKALEIAMRDDPVGPAEAVEIGLANEVVSDDEFEDRLAEQAVDLAGGPTRAYAVTRQLMRTSYEYGLDEQMGREAKHISTLTETGDFARGIEGFFGDGAAAFEGR
jgi:2-(1,2-epoxy-1,2-dihydrophenyl)acetyl-CoA isomerase